MNAHIRQAPRTVLVYSAEEITGDGLIKLPFLAAVRAAFPAAHLAWWAADATVYASTQHSLAGPLLDEIVVASPRGAGAWDWLVPTPLGGRRFDLVIDTQRNLARTLLARRLGGRLISATAGFLLSDARPSGPAPAGMVEQLMQLASLAAGAPLRPLPVRVANAAVLALAERLLPPGPTYVGFAPGAGDPRRRWPADRFAALAERQHVHGRTAVLLVGPAEAELLPQLQAQAPRALLPQLAPEAAGVEALPLAVALAARLTAAVANDGGPAHILAAGGCPLVWLPRVRRKAVKFRPAAPQVEQLLADDYGGEMDGVPLEAVDAPLERLLTATALGTRPPASAGTPSRPR